MGCDYYVAKVLEFTFNNNNYLEIELELTNGYYWYNYDQDEENYEEKVKEYIEECLTPKTQPIPIYKNNQFCNIKLEEKYKKMIDEELKKNNCQWENIIEINKTEKRWERE